MSEPKILLLDIETTPHKVYTWGLFNQNVAVSQIIEPTEVLCWAAKWLGEEEVHYRDWSQDDMIPCIHKMIDEADGVVHYNGKAFDMKHLNREFLLSGLGPPSPYKNIDLLTCIRGNFKFASNKLEWTSLQMGYEGKVQNRGMALWIDCMAGDPKAWEEMRAYNEQDTKLLEGMHDELRPWIKGYPNHNLYAHNVEPTCPNCGSDKLHKRGIQYTAVRAYPRFNCQSCGKWSRGRSMERGQDKGTLQGN
jgi:hypothetical protein